MQAYDLPMILKDLTSPQNQQRQKSEAAIKELRST